jgi:hypothetical protein
MRLELRLLLELHLELLLELALLSVDINLRVLGKISIYSTANKLDSGRERWCLV